MTTLCRLYGKKVDLEICFLFQGKQGEAGPPGNPGLRGLPVSNHLSTEAPQFVPPDLPYHMVPYRTIKSAVTGLISPNTGLQGPQRRTRSTRSKGQCAT